MIRSFHFPIISSMIFIKTLIFLLLQHLALTSSGSSTLVGHHNPPHLSLVTDKAALMAFKKTIIHDPKSTLANWNAAVDVCNFTGVTCDKQHHRVTQLNLTGNELVGLLSPIISNLTGLRKLRILGNHLFCNIPPEICYLRHLRFLRLDQNNLHGSIPDSFALLSKLHVLSISQNNLSGTLPPSLFSNCTLLYNIDLSNNFLTGKIPEEIGDCQALFDLNLYCNQFTGQLPFSLTNASLLYGIDVEYNCLSGELPSKLVGNLPQIVYLHLSYNDMVSHENNTNLDPFFNALGNCTKLLELELAGMALGGRLPSSIGQLGVELKFLCLQENQILGSIPPNLAKFSKLLVLNLTYNLLNGMIPADISQLPSLEQLFLSHNLFTGAIPPTVGKFSHLGLLDLSHNNFFGEIPAIIGNLVRINYLFLNNNFLSGMIPPTLGQCTNLNELDLSYNRLTGSIPPELAGLHEMRIFINLSHNHLEGPLPIELSKLENVLSMDLSSNKFTGSIPPLISSCIALETINFSNNSLEGHLPESIGELKNLKSFDVSGNQLSGMIPTSLNKIPSLTYLNISLNNFEGMIPTGGIFDLVTNMSFMENHQLCRARSSRISGFPTCSEKRRLFHSHVFLIIFILVIFISMICCVIGFWRVRVIIHPQRTETVRRPTTSELIYSIPRITYKELSDATAGFDEQRLVGSGSFGRVYRGNLQDGTAIAVKVLHFQSGNVAKRFNRECEVLKKVRHRNLIRIITACSQPDFKALVLPYMANGSLDSCLYPHSGTDLRSVSSDLSILQRVNICSDIAEGMAYLHHYSPVKVIHSNLKPCNVLLNDDMTALVCDFGIANLVITAGGENHAAAEMRTSSANILFGSIGYIAPEYEFGLATSTKGDVYSFGILVLEIVTKKRPTDDMFVGELSLHEWVKSQQVHHRGLESVVDPSLVRAFKDQSPKVKTMWEVAIQELIQLGILCTQESPFARPTMLQAAHDLDRLKRYLSGHTRATFASSLRIYASTPGND